MASVRDKVWVIYIAFSSTRVLQQLFTELTQQQFVQRLHGQLYMFFVLFLIENVYMHSVVGACASLKKISNLENSGIFELLFFLTFHQR